MLEKHEKLQLFLEENNFRIISSLASTDLYCAYTVVDRDKFNFMKPRQDDEFFVCFNYEAYEGSMFSWDLVNKPCMSEDEFIEELNKIKLSRDVYRPIGSMKDK